MKFWKMHGAGNDFILVDNRDGFLSADKKVRSDYAKKICDRHFGVGADGFICVENSGIADTKMCFYNADGSEATMCGNGIRCYAKYVFDNEIMTQTDFVVETGDGLKKTAILETGGSQSTVLVDMGSWDGKLFEFDLRIIDKTMPIAFLHLGVPHAVCFLAASDQGTIEEQEVLINKYGPIIERNPVFKDGTNVNFVEIIGNNSIIVNTWERGAGRTLACGTGACASAIVCNRLKGLHQSIQVKMPGGYLKVQMDDKGGILMQGEAYLVFKGSYE